MNILGLKNLSTRSLLFQGAVGYGAAYYCSYKYNQLNNAQKELREIPDKKLHLFNIHEKSAESYDKNIEHRELSNKMNTYRRVLLSYAEGKVLEVGVGTGRCLKFYDPK